MRFTKPSWVAHHDPHDPHKRVSIFSLAVHPDGTRVATGGLDAKIRIWATSPILSAKHEAKGHPKSLSTLTMHTGPVLCVRWAASGKWLASGSDDQLIMIWDVDPTGGGKVWGSDDVNIEGWKALRRLTAHESDVTDLAWAPQDRYLASVGLDSKVFIWCGYTLELIRRLDLHQGFVKGVCWDPVGQYLATESDDRTVKIWRSKDWGLEASVEEPFEDSPGSTFFRRLSWSPDGGHITASNAMSNHGAVFVAAVIERGKWNDSSNLSLVGHENIVQVAAYNPRIFSKDKGNSRLSSSNVCSVVALGADDRSISVWNTSTSRPIVVAKEAFDRQILDLSWSLDGRTLWACSSDGTIAVLDFSSSNSGGTPNTGFPAVDAEGPINNLSPKRGTEGELEGIQSAEAGKEWINRYNYDWPPPMEKNKVDMSGAWSGTPARPAYPSHGSSGYGYGGQAPQTPTRPSHYGHSLHGQQSYGSFQTPPKVIHQPPPPNQAQKVTILKNGKKRIQPTFLGGGASVVSSSGIVPGSAAPPSSNYPPQSFNAQPNGHSVRMDWQSDHGGGPNKSNGIGFRIPEGGRLPGQGESRVLQTLPPPPVILGGGSGLGSPTLPRRAHGTANSPLPGLEMPPVLSELSSGGFGSVVFEARNSEDGTAPTELICALDKTVYWIDYIPRRVLCIAKTALFCAVSMEDATLIIYSPQGRRLIPTITLDAPVSVLRANGKFLMAITCSGLVHVWDIQTHKATLTASSIASHFTPMAGSLLKFDLTENGTPLLGFSSGTTIAYSSDMAVWIKVSDGWWKEGLENAALRKVENEKSGLFTAVLTLGHLETRIYAAKLAGSPEQWKTAVLTYTARLAEESFVEKAEELIRELAGPLFWDPERPDPRQKSWEPSCLGIPKREFLQRDVLPIFGSSPDANLQRTVGEWSSLLRRLEAERYSAHRGF